MDIKQLKYFVTIVQEGNISQAAKKLFMSQPPLTKQMNNLEEEVGSKLFIRGSRQIALTEEGKLLYARAQKILELTDIAIGELADIKQGAKGTLRLGLVSSVSEYFIDEWLSGFSKAFPDVRFGITEDNTYHLLEMISDRRLEVAIVRTPFETNLRTVKLCSERLVAVSYDDSFKEKMEINLKEINQRSICVYRRWYNIIKKIIDKSGLVFNPRFINDDAKTSLAIAKANLAVSIVPESIVKANHIEPKYYAHLSDLDLGTDICIVYDNDFYLSSVAKTFIQYLTR